MESKNNLTKLEQFNISLNDVSILRETSFFELYPWYYTDTSDNLKKEIIENLTTLTESQFNAYLKYTKDQIQYYHIFNPNESLIQKWLAKFSLNETEFPFLLNKDILQLIKPNSTSITEEDNQTYFIQKDFHLQAVKIEVINMLAFIDEMLGDEIPTSQPNSVAASKNIYPRIFVNEKAYELFEKLRGEFEGNKNSLANFSFLFHRMKKDGLIFDHLKQLEFVNFLSALNIHIDRIKPKSQMGNEDFRESIYNRIKSS